MFSVPDPITMTVLIHESKFYDSRRTPAICLHHIQRKRRSGILVEMTQEK